ncbi:MraZ protein [Paracoccus alkenifer]|uniref:Transcriptional regulator MraZ n=1 Tax=Paracoccus alkenifer TaxID=65735 RepID=A0A1H6KD00_9RHOB|nr:MraZ protein [Paracoccus alkenifer]
MDSEKVAGLARRFRGSEEGKVDAKGRVSIPARFRRVFESSDPDFASRNRAQLVVVYGFADWTHLRLYTMDAIDEIDEGISRMPRGSAERSYLETLMNGLSDEAEIDADGRLVLPQRLREKIGLEDRVFFMAQGDYLKVSTPETHEADLAAIQADMPALEPGADPLSLLPPAPAAES